jgi:hypothetical protein
MMMLRICFATLAALGVAWGSWVWLQSTTLQLRNHQRTATTEDSYFSSFFGEVLPQQKTLRTKYGGRTNSSGDPSEYADGGAGTDRGSTNRTSLDFAYTPSAFELLSNKKNHPTPVPIQVMEQYMKWHSVDALRRDPRGRKFSVVFYSCPLQAGNRIHHFTTSVYWSIVTNRTLLFKYWDTDTCYKYGSMYSLAICREARTEHDCSAILARAPWIPSLDEFRPLLGLPHDPFALPFYATHPRDIYDFRFPWGRGNDERVRGVDLKYDNVSLVMFAQTRFKITYMDPYQATGSKFADTPNELLWSDWSRNANARLHVQGVDFMFGMILRYSFDLTGAMKSAIPPEASMALLHGGVADGRNRPAADTRSDGRVRGDDGNVDSDVGPDEGYYTIALHSRHVDESLDGCDISRETSCVNELLLRSKVAVRAGSEPKQRLRCAVAVMSDRSCTLSRLVAWLEERGCSAFVARHDTRTDYLSEHGPFAGAGFFQDLALASALSRSAFVGMRRSSSDLVLELVQFYRTLDAWENGTRPDDWSLRRTKVDQCILRPVEHRSKSNRLA